MNTETNQINITKLQSGSSPCFKKQKGLSMISWIVVIVFLLFQAVIAMNVVPVYITDSSVKSMLQDLKTDINAQEASPQELKIMVMRRLSINSIYTIKDDNVSVQRGQNEKIVYIDYEPRGKLIGNLDYIISFEHEAHVPNR